MSSSSSRFEVIRANDRGPTNKRSLRLCIQTGVLVLTAFGVTSPSLARSSFDGAWSVVVVTRAGASKTHRISGLRFNCDEAVARIVKTIAVYDDFCHDNDPWEEHDFGAFEVDGHKIFFKIDYYDPTLTYRSEDPADPTITRRMITIMLLIKSKSTGADRF